MENNIARVTRRELLLPRLISPQAEVFGSRFLTGSRVEPRASPAAVEIGRTSS